MTHIEVIALHPGVRQGGGWAAAPKPQGRTGVREGTKCLATSEGDLQRTRGDRPQGRGTEEGEADVC